MKRLFFVSFLLVAITAPLSTALATQIVLGATRDNTIFRDTSGNSNGLGDNFSAGTQGSATAIRRGLVAFDLTGLPAAIQVDRVALELWFQGPTNMESESRVVSLHRLLANWGEGTSNAGPGGSTGSGNGADATTNDATWRYRFFDTQTWSSYDPAVAGSGGGDFVSQASAMATVGIDSGVLVTWETIRSGPASGLVADVEGWLANPASNSGWLLKGDESVARTARRFFSKDYSHSTLHPRLVIDYTIVPEPATSAMLAVGGMAAWIAICRRR